MVDHELIVNLTREYGKDFATTHAERIIRLVSLLAEGRAFDSEAIWLAAYLHDWGGYPQWIQDGVDHWTRSKDVASEFLVSHGCPSELTSLVLECIEFHHGSRRERSFESILFTDADALDLLGAVGAARVFSMNHRDLRMGWTRLKQYRDMSMAAITLDLARRMADERVGETNAFLDRFEKETFGLY